MDKAIQEFLSRAISFSGVKAVPVSEWDGKSGTLKHMEVDSNDLYREILAQFYPITKIYHNG